MGPARVLSAQTKTSKIRVLDGFWAISRVDLAQILGEGGEYDTLGGL